MDDRFRARADVRFVLAGVGLLVTFRCACCDTKSMQQGSRMLMVRGLRQRVCGPCVPKVEARAKARAEAKARKA